MNEIIISNDKRTITMKKKNGDEIVDVSTIMTSSERETEILFNMLYYMLIQIMTSMNLEQWEMLLTGVRGNARNDRRR